MLQWVRWLKGVQGISGYAKEVSLFAIRQMSKGKTPPPTKCADPKSTAAKAPTAKSPPAKSPPAKSPPAKSPTAKSPPAKSPPAKSPAAKSPPAKSPPTSQKKDETAISGGSKCKPKKKKSPSGSESGKDGAVKLKSCDELLNKDTKKKKKQSLTAIQGGGPCAPKRKQPPADHSGGGMKRWRSISLFAILPMVAILTLLVFSTHKEHEHPEFKHYPHMYKRSKPYWFKDGNRTAFHNSHQNALPPAGYEDEIDEQGVGKEPETEKEKKQRLSDFEKLLKQWKKHANAQ